MAAETLERYKAQPRIFLRIVIATVGALFGGLFLARELGDVPVSRAGFDIESLLWFCGAAAVALALCNLVIPTVARGS